MPNAEQAPSATVPTIETSPRSIPASLVHGALDTWSRGCPVITGPTPCSHCICNKCALHLQQVCAMLAREMMRLTVMQAFPRPDLDDGTVLGAATLRAAAYLGIPSKRLAAIVGISESSLSRMARG